jgi:hypothetical protein
MKKWTITGLKKNNQDNCNIKESTNKIHIYPVKFTRAYFPGD